MDWVGEFFRAIPQVMVALWVFANGWLGVIVTLGSIVLIAGFALAARQLRDSHGWVSATLGATAATIAAWWVFGILPSAWIYFLDGQRELLENTVIPGAIAIGPATIGGLEIPRIDVASNFYQVFRDSVVVLETAVAMVGFTVLAFAIQRRYPRGLAPGEEKGPATGGYK